MKFKGGMCLTIGILWLDYHDYRLKVSRQCKEYLYSFVAGSVISGHCRSTYM